MTTVNTMQLYHLTIQGPSAVTCAVAGQFTGVSRDQQILTANGSQITLHRVDPRGGRIMPTLTHDTFGIIRCMSVFRFAGTHKDYIVVTSDAGRIAILEYVADQNRFVRKQLETFGKSGIRRVVPGQYLAVDAKGRACMLASVEKNKLVYILNRDTAVDVMISSPLEAHVPQALVFALVSLDVGFENPAFAALEVDYSDADKEEPDKQLVYYELDLGLNHVIRKWHTKVQRSANMLFQVPGGEDGPSGVLVCGEDNVTYRHNNQEPQRVPIPRRKAVTEDPSRKRRVVAGVMHRMKGAFFFLLQTEDGDVFKLNLEMEKDERGNLTGEVQSLNIKYFETVPLASALVILKSGYLYVASESGDSHFYKFEGLGDDDDQDVYSSLNFPADPEAPYDAIYFYPRPLTHITLFQTIDGLNPMTGLKVANLMPDEDAPQIYTISGIGPRSAFRTLRHGLEVTELVESQLPRVPTAVYTTKTKADDEFDAYIVLSFTEASLILSIGDTVEEVSDSGFLTSCPTLAVQLLEFDSLVQIHPRGLRLLKAGGGITDWPAPPHRSIVAATTNQRQVCIALSSGELVYFEIDEDGSLNEYESLVKVDEFNPSINVTTIALGPVSHGRKRSNFLAVGCDNSTVRVLRLDPDPEKMMQRISLQALTAVPSAMKLAIMDDPMTGSHSLYLHIGLYSGVYLRTAIDEITGELADTRLRFLGPKPVLLFEVTFEGKAAMLCLSTRTWLSYAAPQTKAFTLTPLDYVPIEWATSFTSHIREEAIVGISGQELRIMYLEDINSTLRRRSVPLKNTPRAFSNHPKYPLFYVAEADQHILPPPVRQQLRNDSNAVNGELAAADLSPEQFGYPKGKGYWTSTIEIVDPVNDTVLRTIELEDNEAAFCATTVVFSSQKEETYLIVGTVQHLTTMPQVGFKQGFIHAYKLAKDGKDMQLVHKTPFEHRPTAMIPFRGRLLVAIGKELRIYDIGLRQILQKSRGRIAPNQIINLQTQGNRIIVTDIQDGPIYVVFKEEDNQLIPFADDTVSRWSTSSAMVDYETVAGGDKFGNLWMVRCPAKASEEADEEGSAAHLVHERQRLGGCANKVQLLAHFYCQDIPTSIQKCQLLAGTGDIILWGGLQGTIGVLIPFVGKEDVEFFHKLELTMRKEDPPLVGRDHLIYRGYYNPVKAVIDGDLCERFVGLPYAKKAAIANEMDRKLRDIEKKIADMRARYAF